MRKLGRASLYLLVSHSVSVFFETPGNHIYFCY